CKAPHIGDDTPTEINQQALSISSEVKHHFPDTHTEIDVFILLSGVDLNDIAPLQPGHRRMEDGQAMRTGIPIGEYEHLGIMVCFDEVIQSGQGVIEK